MQATSHQHAHESIATDDIEALKRRCAALEKQLKQLQQVQQQQQPQQHQPSNTASDTQVCHTQTSFSTFNQHSQLPSTLSSSVSPSNPYSRLLALQSMQVVANYSSIRQVSVAIVGCGGVGSVAAEMLTRCGVGKLLLFDCDTVELANMNRLFYRPNQCGLTKVDAAKQTLQQINKEVEIETFHCNVSELCHYSSFISSLSTGGISAADTNTVKPVSVLLCCVDNYTARVCVNRACLQLNLAWMESGVSEDALNCHIQLMLPGRTACYECCPPLLVESEMDESQLKRDNVCTASLPTTMSLCAALLVQNVLKSTLQFGTVDQYIGYASLNSFFTNFPLKPSAECSNQNCRKLQQQYKQWKPEQLKHATKVKHNHTEFNQQHNEWNIEIIQDSQATKLTCSYSVSPLLPSNSAPLTAAHQHSIDSTNTLSVDELMQQLKNIQAEG